MFRAIIRKHVCKHGDVCFSTSGFYLQSIHKHGNLQELMGQNVKGKTPDFPVEMIRNIGIMAHIDAGKTTTTERMLYFSGLTSHLGNVDRGDTVTDYMEQERNRGITITSAAISFLWNKHKINLIDTPGHVDFTLEVERSLRVLDGAIAVLDSTAGVEAQTLTVWKQANKYEIPRIIYLNKMDRTNASLNKSINSVKEKLHCVPLLTQVPVYSENYFQGVVDLITLRKYIWNVNDGDDVKYTVKEIDKSRDAVLYEQVHTERKKLIEQLADFDDHIANHVLSDMDYDKIPVIDLMNAMRKSTLTQAGVPVLCGSSFKNRGIQPLMNAIVSLLPNPTERYYPFTEYYKNDLCALAFKIIHDKQRGPLTYLRLYSGNLKPGNQIYNVNRNTTEKTGKLLQILADDHKELHVASEGNIVAVTGLKETVTGDTVVSNAQAARTAKNIYMKENSFSDDDCFTPILAGLQVPDPVFMCTIEPPSVSAQKALDHALECLTREDPSLRKHVDNDTKQTILSGMGELHLEIIKDRLLKEYGVDVYMGPLHISYREAISTSVEESYKLDKTIGNTHHRSYVCLSIHPCSDQKQVKIDIVPHKDSELNEKRIWKPVFKAIKAGVESSLSRGPLHGSSVVGVRVEIHDFTKTYKTSLPMVSSCIANCVNEALKTAGPMLLQPMMALEIHTDETYLSSILGDLSKRNSNIIDIDTQNDEKIVRATTPLSQMVGYSTALRTVSSGRATFVMEVSHYEIMGPHEQNKAIKESMGLSGMM